MSTNLQTKDQIVKFGDIAKRVNDLYPDRSKWTFTKYVTGRHFENGEIRIKKSSQIQGNENLIGYQFQWRFQPGDILYVVKNPRLRKAAIVDFEGICSISTYVIRADETKFLQKLLPFLLQTEKFTTFARRSQHGSTNPFLNWPDIAKFEFHLPSLDEQKEILNILWTIEKHIENLENLIEKTKNYAISRHESLLTRGIGHTKFEKVKWMFGKTIKIPEGWKLGKLGQNSIIKGRIGWQGLTTAEYRKEGKYHLVTGTDFKEGKISWGSCVFVDENRYEQDPHIQLKNNDVLVTKDGTIGKIAYVDTLVIPATLNTGMFVIRPIDEAYIPLFFYYILESQYFQLFLNILKSGTTINHLFQSDFENFIFPIPSLLEQKQIIQYIKTIKEQITQQQSHLTNLKELRKSILNSKLTGEKPIVAN